MAASTGVDIDRVVAHGIELESGSLKPTHYHSEFHSVCARKGQSGHHGHAVVRGAAPTSRATAPYTAHFMAHRMYGSSQQMRHGTPCVDLAMIRPICDVVHLCAKSRRDADVSRRQREDAGRGQQRANTLVGTPFMIV